MAAALEWRAGTYSFRTKQAPRKLCARLFKHALDRVSVERDQQGRDLYPAVQLLPGCGDYGHREHVAGGCHRERRPIPDCHTGEYMGRTRSGAELDSGIKEMKS